MERNVYRRLLASARRGNKAALTGLFDHFVPDLHQYAELGCDSSEKAELLVLAIFKIFPEDVKQLRLTERELQLHLFRRARLLLGAQDQDLRAAFPFILRRTPEEICAAIAGEGEDASNLLEHFRRLAQLSRGEQEVIILTDSYDFTPEEAAWIMNISLPQFTGLLEQANAKWK